MGLRTGTWLAGGIAALVAGALFVALRPDDADLEPVGDVVETESVPATVALGGRPPAAVAAPPPSGAVDSAERPGSVRMRVVRAPDDAPVPGIPVFLRRDVAPRGPFHLLAWTDERGLVTFPEVWPGTGLRLRVQAGAGPQVERDDLVVSAGAVTDLGDVRLGPLGLVDALVVDETGKPIEDARVVATLDPETIASLDADPYPLPPDPPSPVAVGRSDNHGRVRLEGVPPGIVALRATKTVLRGATDRVRVPAAGADSGVVTIVLRPATAAGLVVFDDGRPVVDASVRIGEERLDAFSARGAAKTDATGLATFGGFAEFVLFDAEFDVRERGSYQVHDVRTAAVERVALGPVGRYVVVVVNEAGAPVEGARVGARSSATRTRIGVGSKQRDPKRAAAKRPSLGVDAVGVTGADGRVTLDTGDPPHGIWVLHPDYLAYGDPPALRLTRPRAEPTRSEADRDPAPRIVLSRGVRVAGHVTAPGGGKVAGAVVRAVGSAERDPARSRADARGRFELGPVRPERTGWIVATQSSPDLYGWCPFPRGATSAQLGSVDVTMYEPARARGRVTDAHGARVEGARVSILGTLFETWTDARGEFVLGPLFTVGDGRPPTMVVEATRIGLGAARVRAAWPRPGRDVEDLQLSVGETKDVEGYVQDGERRSVPFPIVELVDTSDATGSALMRTVSADEFGRFVVRDVLPGTYHVRARTRGLEGYARNPVQVSADPRVEPKVVPVTATPSRTLRGTVLLARDGTPVAGVRVLLRGEIRVGESAPGVAAVDSATSDADGRFTFTTVRLDEVVLMATAADPDGGGEVHGMERVRTRDTDSIELELR